MTNAAAAGELPDVVLGDAARPVRSSTRRRSIFDSEAAQAVVDKLGADTFSQKALDLVSADGKATGVPSDGWGQLLIYRKDLFDKAGLAARRSRSTTCAPPPRSSTATAWPASRSPPKAGDGFTAETFEHVALAQGCQLVDDDGKVTFDSPQCVEALRWYGDIASNYSVSGAQDVDSTRGTYFAGQAAMMFWSPFLLDGMAGLRDDTKPSCDECKDNPAFLAENSGLVGPAERRAAAAEPVRRRLDRQHRRRRPDRGRAEARRVHAHRRLRALARALAAGQVPGPRRRQRGPEEVPDGVGGARERRGHARRR